MRLFIAIPLPEEIKKEFARAKELFPRIPARWVEEEKLHLTLVFIGKENRVEEIGQVLDNLTPKSIKLKTGPLLIFPSLKRPRILAIRVFEENGELTALAKEIKKGLREVEIPFDKKPFNPHITLARLKGDFLDKEKISSSKIPEREFTVDRIELKESRLTPTGSIYQTLKGADIGCLC